MNSTGLDFQAQDALAGWPRRGGARGVVKARAALSRLLWTHDGRRRLPSQRALDRRLAALPRSELEWIFEFNPLGPLWFLPTREWIRALSKALERQGVKRVLEVAAGDGLISAALSREAPRLRVIATDSGSWERPAARMNARERRELRSLPVPGVRLGSHVRKLDALAAIERHRPDLVLASWLPPGGLLDALIQAPVRYVLDIGAPGGITAGQWSWRFSHTFWDGPLERLARCRLDARPRVALHSRVTLYFGAAHDEHFEEPVQRGDWLWQFRPRRLPRRG